MVSDEPTEGRCNAKAGTDKEGYCEAYPVSGANRCRMHGGTSEGGARDGAGAPEGNTNSVSHGLFAETNHFYQEVMNDTHRELCDTIYEDYLEKFREVNGEPITGEKSRLFEISVNHIKIIYSDNWAVDKPDELESGSPIVDKETHKKTYTDRDGNTHLIDEYRYKENVTIATQQKLRREDRAWLRDYNLLDDPESQKADALGDITVDIGFTHVTEENVDEFTDE